MPLLFVYYFLMIAAIAITFLMKIEDHFSYLKILFPKELEKYSSRASAQTDFSYFRQKVNKIDSVIFMPAFWDRQLEIE